jgi:hypothetical protein
MEKWIHTAAELGIPVQAIRRATHLGSPPETSVASGPGIAATVVGDRSLGDVRLVDWTRALAATAGVDMLTAYYRDCDDGNDSSLTAVSLWPEIANAEIQCALRGFFGDRGIFA